MQVRLFGELEALDSGVPVPVRGAKQRALLALLALHRGELVSADRLIDVLWGDGQVANPANACHPIMAAGAPCGTSSPRCCPTGPPLPDSKVELIVRFLAGRSLLVVFDNCRHVIGQAAALAETLAGTVPGLRLVATSREPLGVPGEILVPVDPLARPAAVELCTDRARCRCHH